MGRATKIRWNWGAIAVGAMLAAPLVGCGSSAPPPPPPEDETAGHEEPPPPPPPPPPPASVRVVHASPDPGLATLSIALDGEAPIVTHLAAASASDALEVAAGTHALRVLGVASVETGEAPVVLETSVELAPGSRPILLAYGEPAAEPAFVVTVLDADVTGTTTRARVVHGLVGLAAVDVCVAGAPIAAALAPGAIASVSPVAEGNVAIELHTASDVACHGRTIGTVRTELAASRSYVIALSGRAARRGRVTGSAIVCSEGEGGACTSVAIASR